MKRRLFRWLCFSCGATGTYDPKTGAGVIHRAGCALEAKGI